MLSTYQGQQSLGGGGILKESLGRLNSLIPKSRRPKRVRTMKVIPEVITFIRDIREKHPRIVKRR
jgi:hypothetical protein